MRWFISVLAASTMGQRSSLTTFILRDRGSFLFPCAAAVFAALLELRWARSSLPLSSVVVAGAFLVIYPES